MTEQHEDVRRPDPISVRKPEPARTEPARTEPAKPEPVRSEPARSEPARQAVVARAPQAPQAPQARQAPRGNAVTLMAEGESEKLTRSLQQAVGGFVDEPRNAVQEADRVLDEATARLAEGIKERRQSLRSTWQGNGDKSANGAETEDLRIALRQYRDLVQQLLRI